MTDSLAERLTPTHLVPDVIEIKEDVVEGLKEEKSPIQKQTDGRSQKEWTFKFKYKNGHGKLWEGEFTNKILSIRQRQEVGIIRARMQVGLPSGSIDPLTEEINLMVAHLSISLIKKPKWADSLQDLEDIELLQALYLEVASHEAYFFGRGQDQKRSGD